MIYYSYSYRQQNFLHYKINIFSLFSMENLSTLGYKTFASQFSYQPRQGAQNSSFQQKSFAIKKDKLLLLHSLGANNKRTFAQKNDNDLTLLHFTAYYNSPTCALYLLHQNVPIDALDKQGKSVFHLCAYTGHVVVMSYIVQFWKIRKIKQVNDNFIRILTKIGFKRTDAKSSKLKFQVSKQRQSKFLKGCQQITTLYRHYRACYTDFMLSIIQQSETASNRNCFHMSSMNRYQRCLATMEYMVKSLHNQDLNLTHEFMIAINQIQGLVGDGFVDPRQLEDALGIIKEFVQPAELKVIDKEANDKVRQVMQSVLLAKDKNSHNPIYLASKTGSAAIVALLKRLQQKYPQKNLISTGLSEDVIKIALNNSARNQITDLCEASKNADVEIINFLISCGEQINKKKTIFGTFALLQAIKAYEKEKRLQPIKILLKSGADINEQDSNGWTIFHHIAEKGYTEILKLIFSERQQKRITKLGINKATNKGYHMLHVAAMNDRVQIIQLMLKQDIVKAHEVDLNPLDGNKATMLHYAAKKGSLKTLRKILQLKGRDMINHCDINGNTCLHIAAMNNHDECIRQLVYFDSDFDNLIKTKNKKGKLPKDLTLKKKLFDSVFTAARQGDVNTIRNLSNEKSSVIDSSTPVKNRTPLILSVMEMQLVNVKFLVDLQADQYHQDTEGKTAAQYGQQLEYLYTKKDKSKLTLIKKIRALLD